MSLPVHLEQLRITRERLDTMLSRIRTVADQFNGPRPEQLTKTDGAEASPFLNSQFGEVISDIQVRCDSINEHITRLEDEIRDNGPGGSVGLSRSTRLGDNF